MLRQCLRQFCCVLQTLPAAMQPELIVALYRYQQILTEEVKQQLRKYVKDDNKLSELLQQRLFDISLSELLWESSIIPDGKKN